MAGTDETVRRFGLRAKMMWVILACIAGVLVALIWATKQPWVRPERVSSPEGCGPSRLEHHVRTLSSDFFPRDHAHPENLDRAAAYIREVFEGFGLTAWEQPFGRDQYRNVVARLGPQEGARIVVGAHYDAAGEHPAADDNASGVAGLLELARLWAGRVPRVPMEFVAYTLEEPPYFATPMMGSAVHARSLREEGAEVRAMISLEMLGYFRDEPGSQRYPTSMFKLFYPSVGNFIVVVGRWADAGLTRRLKAAMLGATDLPIESINAPRILPGVDFSDHRNYWNEGYPAVMVTDTSFYRNPNYHRPEDTPDTLDYHRMAKAVDAVSAALEALQLAPHR